ncbi:hypothetical protein [Roseobacter ponti]|uniref:Uncharacterized protein n=1 Tax=Roseobacter ponti TaxID=1891787 RepID=A0A858ST94_9RHOB|nr:hypothetical protein [Roseobacter ponti]QJF51158.1 hypothetical protein G3256_08290 [Roseobacter ponti]
MSAPQKNSISDAALAGLLARLGSAELAQTLPRDRTAALEVLLREINETVLPRSLKLSADGIQLGALDVANRRLVAVGLGDDAPGDTDVTTLAGVLGLICETGAEVTLTNAGRAGTAGDPDTGASVPALRAALAGRHQMSGVAVMLESIATDTVACLHWNDLTATGGAEEAGAGCSGDPAWFPRLEAFVAGMRNGPAGGPDGGLLVPLADDLTLIACGDARAGVAAVMASAPALQAMQSWQSLMGARSD